MSLQTNAEHAHTYGSQADTSPSSSLAPARKRQKGDGPIAKNSRRSLKSLSGLPELPIDILFEIFSNLAPKDLLNLSRTTKAFRRLLHDCRSSTVWKAARRCTFPGAPECPDDLSEPFWANLLFGDNVCEHCGAKNVRRVFFELRRRLCASCIKNNSVKPSQFEFRFPDYDEEVLGLVPYVIGVGGGGPNVKHYWEADVIEVGEKLVELLEAIGPGCSEAVQELEDFRNKQKARVEARLEDAARCYAYTQDRGKTLQHMKEARLKEICSRFVALGLNYEESDVRKACRDLKLQAAPLTERAWNAIRKEREKYVKLHMEDRLEETYRTVREARRLIADGLYMKFDFGINACQMHYLPGIRHVCGFPEFLEVINSDHTRTVVREDFADAMQKLPLRVGEWLDDMETRLLNLIPTPYDSGKDKGDATSPAMERNPRSLGLATYVATCDHAAHCPDEEFVERKGRGDWCGDVAFGFWETFGHLMHESQLYELPPMEPVWTEVLFSTLGSVVAARVVESVGLDPSTTTVGQMDEHEAWFLCTTCKAVDIEGVDYRPVMNWRQFVNHSLDESAKGNKEHEPCLLGEGEREMVRKVDEDARDDPQYAVWQCAHRCAFLFKPKDIVLLHARQKHGIHQPIYDRDYCREPVFGCARRPLHYISTDGKIHSKYTTLDPPVTPEERVILYNAFCIGLSDSD